MQQHHENNETTTKQTCSTATNLQHDSEANATSQQTIKWGKTFIGLGTAIIAGILVYLFALYYLHASLKISTLIGIIAFLVTLWTNKALPMGVVSLLPIILFPSFGILDTKSTTSNYGNPIIFLFLGGFMIATATEKIGLHRVIAKVFLSKFPKNPQGVIAALGVAATVLGTALSNSTVALLLLPVAMSITQDKFLQTRFLLAVAFGASISGITTPIGSPPNLIYLGFLESQGLSGISFTTWIFMMSPLTVLMLYAMIKILSFNTRNHELNLSIFESITITMEHKRLLGFIALLLAILLINSPIRPVYDGLGWNENIILLAFGLMMFLPKIGFLNWDDSKSIPYEIIFLFGAGFCIAMAFSQAELGGAFQSFLQQFANLPFILIVLLSCVGAIIATGFLSTTALIAILLPIINVATSGFLNDTEKILLMLVVTICASFSFMIPISTPPNAIVFSQGGIKTWDMVRFGFILSLVGIVCVTIFCTWYWWSFII
ncbi:SLC13/DASS family transporter [Helicobacter aurati]|uniref:SLC13/DASS family transporter n=1 Tax=Helicobacter aurati TaxID=137778 RepID=A0A3D8J8K5_9HELI|nr:SLC13 family permease [Helicobacter aurati]RDU73839.1 SLC13/DASS family transporter [Helicobacter aurati]